MQNNINFFIIVYCYFGSLATECFLKSNWPDFPVALQKRFIFMIANIQKSIDYHGFEIVELNLETLDKIKRFPKKKR